jgi:hypothetical protein
MHIFPFGTDTSKEVLLKNDEKQSLQFNIEWQCIAFGRCA